jgi:phosphomevalonate kinase
VRLSAPGKLFLTGEYAVLWGAPAALAAVAPRILASLKALPGTGLLLRVPGGSVAGRLTTPGEVAWNVDFAPARFASRAIALGLAHRKAAQGVSVRFQPSPRGRKGQKLGLGTSAAAVAAGVLAALYQPGQPVDPDVIFPLAAQAHWEIQGKKGSNGDVAAACYGGVLVYTRYPIESAVRPARPDVRRLNPGSLRLALVSSGKAAKTPSMVTAVEKALSLEAREAFVRASTTATLAFADALEAGRHADALAALNQAGDLLQDLGQQAGVEVVTPTLAQIQALGRERGLGAKVSGAGGGDGALFASFDADALASALEEARARGFDVLPLSLSPGVGLDGR